MSTRITLGIMGGTLGMTLLNSQELNGANGTLNIILPVMGGTDYEGGVVVMANLPEIKNKVCEPYEEKDMGVGGC
jgi:hypothetical protein